MSPKGIRDECVVEMNMLHQDIRPGGPAGNQKVIGVVKHDWKGKIDSNNDSNNSRC